ncbi:cycloisomaltooligosaccharide glucanotransferase, partial [Limosilactobacillus reuteri]
NVANVPIEGFLGDFGPNLSESNMQKVVKQMNRMHVNYVQFYDWYDRDDMPLRIVNGQPEQNWLDFMKRPISFNTVKSYIDAVHQYGMQAMLYNLIYGSQLGIPTSDDSNLNWVNPNLT